MGMDFVSPLISIELSTPVVILKQALHLDNVAAATVLKRVLGEAVHSAVDGLQQVQVVAAALVLERSLGSTSSWWEGRCILRGPHLVRMGRAFALGLQHLVGHT